ncbi:MAG: hypothetical protein RR395_03580 [Ruthenibacterium sp.]
MKKNRAVFLELAAFDFAGFSHAFILCTSSGTSSVTLEYAG